MTPKGATQGQSVYKNRIGVLQSLCSIVRERIKGAPSLCLILSLLYSSYFTASVVWVWNKQPHVSHHKIERVNLPRIVMLSYPASYMLLPSVLNDY